MLAAFIALSRALVIVVVVVIGGRPGDLSRRGDDRYTSVRLGVPARPDTAVDVAEEAAAAGVPAR